MQDTIKACVHIDKVLLGRSFSCFRVQPGCLGSIDSFTEEFVVPIETGQKRDASKRELALARKGIGRRNVQDIHVVELNTIIGAWIYMLIFFPLYNYSEGEVCCHQK
jgi:hypothetical protein